MDKKLKDYLNTVQMRYFIEQEAYENILIHMDLDKEFSLMPDFLGLLHQCGVDIEKISIETNVIDDFSEEVQAVLSHEFSVKIVLCKVGRIKYGPYDCEALLWYGFIHDGNYYPGCVEIVFDKKLRDDWPKIFEESNGLIINDIEARIRDNDYVN